MGLTDEQLAELDGRAPSGPAAKGWVPLVAAGELDRQGAGVAPST